jgi:hypothetical protein
MEGGLHQTALAEMRRALIGQQPFTKQCLGALKDSTLYEMRVLGDQRLLHQRGRVQEVHVLMPGAEVAKVAVFGGAVGQELDRIGAEGLKTAA